LSAKCGLHTQLIDLLRFPHWGSGLALAGMAG
jgi:hypothetical protein